MQYSVKDIVSEVYQDGDLNASYNYERAILGTRAHQYIQSQRQGNYQKEYYLKIDYEIDNESYTIDGRCDGIYFDTPVIIEEIKSTLLPIEEIDDHRLIHFAQAYFYAYIYATNNHQDQIIIHLTYVQVDKSKSKTFKQRKSYAFLQSFFEETMKLFHDWKKQQDMYQQQGVNALKKLIFPFDNYRKEQFRFASSVYKTIIDKQSLFIQAPCGIGKTISTLFPSLKAIGENKVTKIFYLCAKNVTMKVAIDTTLLLLKQDIHFHSIVIYAKDKICLCEKRNCDPHVCPYAKGYYGRNKQAINEILASYDYIDKETIIEYSNKHTICPFELTLDLSLYCELIICDYNYIYDPRVYLKRYFVAPVPYVILVDEAHNLIDRARSMYSIALSKAQIEEVIPLCPKKLAKQFNYLIEEMDNLHKQYGSFYASKNLFNSFLETIKEVSEVCFNYFINLKKPLEHEDEIKALYFELINYQKISEYFNDDFLNIIQGDQDITIEIFCINPSSCLNQVNKLITSTIYFSATISPIKYYMDLLIGSKSCYQLCLSSPFSKEQLKFCIHDHISTRYHDRLATIPQVILSIKACIQSQVGNYIVFFPSYQYLEMLYPAYRQFDPNQIIHVQSKEMDEDSKQAFLKNFENHQQSQLFFCVLGGMFSEGIDLKAEKLIGVIILSLGLAQPNVHLELIKEYFNERGEDGYSYSYRYPAMNKVLQAAGRVIRSHDDKGILVLLDDRYHQPFYQALFPSHLHHYQFVDNENTLFQIIQSFWRNNS